MNIICLILGHDYLIERKLSVDARKVRCGRCDKAWAMHDPTMSFLEWDNEFEEFYKKGGILNP